MSNPMQSSEKPLDVLEVIKGIGQMSLETVRVLMLSPAIKEWK